MPFEFDPQKSELNLKKHGIDFFQAQLLWEDPERIVFPARTIDEPRYMIIGRIEKKHWSCIFTVRDENIRIISVRRSRKEEVEIYES